MKPWESAEEVPDQARAVKAARRAAKAENNHVPHVPTRRPGLERGRPLFKKGVTVPDNSVTREECGRTHEPIAEFIRDTKTNFERVHLRLDKISTSIIGLLITIIASLSIQLIASKTIEKPQAKIDVVIDRSAIDAIREKP